MIMAIWLNGAACGSIVTTAFIALILAMAAWNRRVYEAQRRVRPPTPQRPQPHGGRLVDISPFSKPPTLP
jgi:hypothetical protein